MSAEDAGTPKLPRWLLLNLAGALFAACVPTAQTPPEAAPSSPPQTVRISEADDGGAVNLRQGDTLEIELPANLSMGFT